MTLSFLPFWITFLFGITGLGVLRLAKRPQAQPALVPIRN